MSTNDSDNISSLKLCSGLQTSVLQNIKVDSAYAQVLTAYVHTETRETVVVLHVPPNSDPYAQGEAAVTVYADEEVFPGGIRFVVLPVIDRVIMVNIENLTGTVLWVHVNTTGLQYNKSNQASKLTTEVVQTEVTYEGVYLLTRFEYPSLWTDSKHVCVFSRRNPELSGFYYNASDTRGLTYLPQDLYYDVLQYSTKSIKLYEGLENSVQQILESDFRFKRYTWRAVHGLAGSNGPGQLSNWVYFDSFYAGQAHAHLPGDGTYIYSTPTLTWDGHALFNGEWFELELPEAVYLYGYIILPPWNPRMDPTEDLPTRFVLLGSTDGTTWVALDERDDPPWPDHVNSGGMGYEFILDTSRMPVLAYRFFRFVPLRASAQSALRGIRVQKFTVVSTALPSGGSQRGERLHPPAPLLPLRGPLFSTTIRNTNNKTEYCEQTFELGDRGMMLTHGLGSYIARCHPLSPDIDMEKHGPMAAFIGPVSETHYFLTNIKNGDENQGKDKISPGPAYTLPPPAGFVTRVWTDKDKGYDATVAGEWLEIQFPEAFSPLRALVFPAHPPCPLASFPLDVLVLGSRNASHQNHDHVVWTEIKRFQLDDYAPPGPAILDLADSSRPSGARFSAYRLVFPSPPPLGYYAIAAVQFVSASEHGPGGILRPMPYPGFVPVKQYFYMGNSGRTVRRVYVEEEILVRGETYIVSSSGDAGDGLRASNLFGNGSKISGGKGWRTRAGVYSTDGATYLGLGGGGGSEEDNDREATLVNDFTILVNNNNVERVEGEFVQLCFPREVSVGGFYLEEERDDHAITSVAPFLRFLASPNGRDWYDMMPFCTPSLEEGPYNYFPRWNFSGDFTLRSFVFRYWRWVFPRFELVLGNNNNNNYQENGGALSVRSITVLADSVHTGNRTLYHQFKPEPLHGLLSQPSTPLNVARDWSVGRSLPKATSDPFDNGGSRVNSYTGVYRVSCSSSLSVDTQPWNAFQNGDRYWMSARKYSTYSGNYFGPHRTRAFAKGSNEDTILVPGEWIQIVLPRAVSTADVVSCLIAPALAKDLATEATPHRWHLAALDSNVTTGSSTFRILHTDESRSPWPGEGVQFFFTTDASSLPEKTIKDILYQYYDPCKYKNVAGFDTFRFIFETLRASSSTDYNEDDNNNNYNNGPTRRSQNNMTGVAVSCLRLFESSLSAVAVSAVSSVTGDYMWSAGAKGVSFWDPALSLNRHWPGGRQENAVSKPMLMLGFAAEIAWVNTVEFGCNHTYQVRYSRDMEVLFNDSDRTSSDPRKFADAANLYVINCGTQAFTVGLDDAGRFTWILCTRTAGREATRRQENAPTVAHHGDALVVYMDVSVASRLAIFPPSLMGSFPYDSMRRLMDAPTDWDLGAASVVFENLDHGRSYIVVACFRHDGNAYAAESATATLLVAPPAYSVWPYKALSSYARGDRARGAVVVSFDVFPSNENNNNIIGEEKVPVRTFGRLLLPPPSHEDKEDHPRPDWPALVRVDDHVDLSGRVDDNGSFLVARILTDNTSEEAMVAWWGLWGSLGDFSLPALTQTLEDHIFVTAFRYVDGGGQQDQFRPLTYDVFDVLNNNNNNMVQDRIFYEDHASFLFYLDGSTGRIDGPRFLMRNVTQAFPTRVLQLYYPYTTPDVTKDRFITGIQLAALREPTNPLDPRPYAVTWSDLSLTDSSSIVAAYGMNASRAVTVSHETGGGGPQATDTDALFALDVSFDEYVLEGPTREALGAADQPGDGTSLVLAVDVDLTNVLWSLDLSQWTLRARTLSPLTLEMSGTQTILTDNPVGLLVELFRDHSLCAVVSLGFYELSRYLFPFQPPPPSEHQGTSSSKYKEVFGKSDNVFYALLLAWQEEEPSTSSSLVNGNNNNGVLSPVIPLSLEEKTAWCFAFSDTAIVSSSIFSPFHTILHSPAQGLVKARGVSEPDGAPVYVCDAHAHGIAVREADAMLVVSAPRNIWTLGHGCSLLSPGQGGLEVVAFFQKGTPDPQPLPPSSSSAALDLTKIHPSIGITHNDDNNKGNNNINNNKTYLTFPWPHAAGRHSRIPLYDPAVVFSPQYGIFAAASRVLQAYVSAPRRQASPGQGIVTETTYRIVRAARESVFTDESFGRVLARACMRHAEVDNYVYDFLSAVKVDGALSGTALVYLLDALGMLDVVVELRDFRLDTTSGARHSVSLPIVMRFL
jgi:hypothetical protein